MGEFSDYPDELGGTLDDWNPSGATDGAGGAFDTTSLEFGDANFGGGDEFAAATDDSGPDLLDVSPEALAAVGVTGSSGSHGRLTSQAVQLARTYVSVGGKNGVVVGDSAPDVDIGDLAQPGSPGRALIPIGGTSRTTLILRAVAATLGMRVRARTIVGLILRLGWKAAAAATGLGAKDLLYLFIRQKTRRKGRLGPHLRTIERRCHQADRYRKRVAKLAGHIHANARHHAAPSPFRRRARRHAR